VSAWRRTAAGETGNGPGLKAATVRYWSVSLPIAHSFVLRRGERALAAANSPYPDHPAA
jgi:hypothetical protein